MKGSEISSKYVILPRLKRTLIDCKWDFVQACRRGTRPVEAEARRRAQGMEEEEVEEER